MARKQKVQEEPAKDGPIFVTYIGPLNAVLFEGQCFARDKPVQVASADPYAKRSFFKVSNGDLHAD